MINKTNNGSEVVTQVESQLRLNGMIQDINKLLKHSFHEIYTSLAIVKTSLELQEMEHGSTEHLDNIKTTSLGMQKIYDNIYYSVKKEVVDNEPEWSEMEPFVADRLKYFNILKHFNKNSLLKLSENLSYDFKHKSMLKDNKSLDLTAKQSAILYILMKNMGHVVSFETISSFVYDDGDHALHTISSHISDLRKLLGDDIIKNIRGIGYKITIL